MFRNASIAIAITGILASGSALALDKRQSINQVDLVRAASAIQTLSGSERDQAELYLERARSMVDEQDGKLQASMYYDKIVDILRGTQTNSAVALGAQ